MPGDISTRFSRKVTIVSFVLAVFVMYIHAKIFHIMILVTHTVLSFTC